MVALVDATSQKVVTVTNQAKAYVDAACAEVSGIAVTPPAAPGLAPVVAVNPVAAKPAG